MTNEEMTQAVNDFNADANPAITTQAVNERIIDALAAAIVDDDSGFLLSEIDTFADLLTAHAYQRLCIALDQCPFHGGDIETCMDDDRDCATLLDEMFPTMTFGSGWDPMKGTTEEGK